MSTWRGIFGQVSRATSRAARSSLARASGVYIVASGASALISFLLVPILTRLLGPGDYGLVASFSALVSIGSVVVGLSTHGLLSVRFFKPGPAPFASYVGASLVVLACSATVTAIVVAAFSAAIEHLSGVPMVWQFAALAAAMGQFGLMVTLAVLQAQRRAFVFGVIQVATAALGALASVLLVAGADLGWRGRALALAGANAAAAVVGIALMRAAGDLSFNVARQQIFEALRFGAPLVPHLLAGVVMATVDRLTISARIGMVDAGVYFAAFQICSIISLLTAAVNQAWVPWLYERISTERVDARHSVVRVTYLLFALFAATAAVLAVSAPWLVRVIAGETYGAAVVHIRFLAPAAALLGMYYLVANYIFYAGRTELMAVLTVSVSVLQVVLTIGLVDAYGAVGAAAAALVSAFVYFMATWYIAQHCVPMPWFGRAA